MAFIGKPIPWPDGILSKDVPIFGQGVLIGACGVGGGTAQEDEDCARARGWRSSETLGLGIPLL